MAVTLYIEYVFLCKKVRENHNCIQREFIQLSREFCMYVYVRLKLHKRIIFIPSNERDAFMFMSYTVDALNQMIKIEIEFERRIS